MLVAHAADQLIVHVAPDVKDDTSMVQVTVSARHVEAAEMVAETFNASSCSPKKVSI